MKKIYLNRMEKKTWNHININEKVMIIPYIEFKENEEIIGSINDRIRKIPNPGNYTRKDQEHENNSINNIYVIEKIEEAEEKVNLKQENIEEIFAPLAAGSSLTIIEVQERKNTDKEPV